MEILINVIGYAGFIAVATYHKSPGEKFPDRWAPERRALVRLVRFTRSADQPVGLDQGMAAFSLRPQWKADHDEGKQNSRPTTMTRRWAGLSALWNEGTMACFPHAIPIATADAHNAIWVLT
jgi:hypothetical protein